MRASDSQNNKYYIKNNYIAFLNLQMANPLANYQQLKSLMEKIVIFLCIMMAVASASDCNGFHSEDLLQSGVVTFSKNQNLNRQHCQNININYNVPSTGFDVALSPNNYFFSYGAVDFSLRGGKGYRNDILEIILLINNDQSWSTFKVSYLVSSRSDMWLGSYIANTFDLIDCSPASSSTKKAFKSTFPVASWKNSVGAAKAYAFISGIRTQSTNIQLSIDTVQFNQITGNITISITSVGGASYQYIHFDYVVFENTPFTIVANTIPSSNPQIDYSLVGLDTFSYQQQSIYIQIGIISKWMQCFGNCSKTCIIDDDCNIVKGSKNGRKCYICPQNQYYNNYSCVSQCQDNQYWNGTQCVCINFFIKYQGKCVPKPNCSYNQQYNEVWNKCDCKSQWILINGNCQPIPTCKKYQIYNISTNRCECVDGYALVNGQCSLRPICLANQIYASNLNLCVCIDGWIKYKGICSQKPICNFYQTYNTQWNRCDCNNGYTLVNNKCFPIVKCAQNEVYIAVNNSCDCRTPFVYQSGKCVPKANCTQYQNYQSQWNNCVCKDGYILLNNDCYPKPNCNSYEIYDPQSNTCICKQGYSKVNGVCTITVINCGLNETLVNNSCVCIDGFIRLGPICVSKCSVNQKWSSNKCDCVDGHYWNNKVCRPCPENSYPNSDKSACICNTGFNEVNGQCIKKQCPINSYFYNGKCLCADEYYQDQGKCVPTPKCPSNSVWNSVKLICECTINNQYLINGICQQCSANSGWNGEKCVCRTNYYLIDKVCRTCANNTNYNGKDCVCNQGWYGNRDGCWKCHDTCGTCTGKQANQCTSCVDVSYNLNNDGTCSRKTPCPIGLYQNNGNCKPCSSYCGECNSPYTCDKCINGFKLQNISYGGQLVASFCTQICGDGKRFQDECDDGNLVNGDGCSSLCKVEKGWTCAGGSSTRPSTCSSYIPQNSIIIPKGAVALFGKVVHGFRLSYIPNNLTQNDCAECSKLLWVKVIKSSIVPGVRVNYIPKSKFQYLLQFDFYGTIAPPVFEFTVQINPQYAKYFSDSDMSQLITKTIDPSTLKKYENDGELSLNDLNSAAINLSPEATNTIFT